MTAREWRRRDLLETIRRWMLSRASRGCGLFVSAAFLSCGVCAAAEVKSTEAAPVLKPITAKAVSKPVSKSAAKAAAQPEKKTDEKVFEKTLKGTVGFIRKDKMSVEFASDEKGGQEMFLLLDKKITLSGIKDFNAIQYGDHVQVKFLETVREPKEKEKKTVVLNRVVTEIKFLKAAPRARTAQSDALVGSEGAS